MSSAGTNSRQQSIQSTEAIQEPTETPLTSLVSSRAQSLGFLTVEPPKNASLINYPPTLLDHLRTSCPHKQNEFNFHTLLDPDKPTRPTKTTMKDGSSRFAQYLREPVCQQPRQYAFPTSFAPYNTQDTFDWKDPGCRWWVRELWLREGSGGRKWQYGRNNISEQTKLWRFSGEEPLRYRSNHISDSRRLIRGALNEGEEEEDESRQVLARTENEMRQVPEELLRAGSFRRNHRAGSTRLAETDTKCDSSVNATLEYVSATLEQYLRTRQDSSIQHNTENSPPQQNSRDWTDRQVRLFPETWRRELLRDPSLRVSRALKVSHPLPRSAFREQRLVGQSLNSLHPPTIDTPRDTYSHYTAEVSRLRHQGRGVHSTNIRVPSPRSFTNVGVGRHSLHEHLPMLHYGRQGQSPYTSVPPPIGNHGRSRTAQSGAHLPRSHERSLGPSPTSFASPLSTVNRGPGSNHEAQFPRSGYGSHLGQTDFNLRPVARPSTNSNSTMPIPVPVAHTLLGGRNTGTIATMPSQNLWQGARRDRRRRQRAGSSTSFLTNQLLEEADSGEFDRQREEVLRSLINARRPG